MGANVYKNIEKCFELMSSYLLLRLIDSLTKAICPALNEIINIEEYREGGREGDAKGKRYGNICICTTDSLCYKADTNTPL